MLGPKTLLRPQFVERLVTRGPTPETLTRGRGQDEPGDLGPAGKVTGKQTTVGDPNGLRPAEWEVEVTEQRELKRRSHSRERRQVGGGTLRHFPVLRPVCLGEGNSILR